jgi:hypothetical protein
MPMYLVEISTGIAFAIGCTPELGTDEDLLMWNLVNCYLSGRHDYGMWCEPGAIFLRCVHCGKRSSGWTVEPKAALAQTRATVVAAPPVANRRVLPFGRAALR